MQSYDDALLDVIYGAVASPHSWTDVLTRVSDHLGAIGGIITYAPKRGRPLSIVGRLSAECTDVYHEHYPLNPWTLGMMDAPNEQAVLVNSLTEPGALLKSGFYADVLAPQRIVDAMQFSHGSAAGSDWFGGFGFMLSARGADKASQNITRLQRLAPHLARALDATIELGHWADGLRPLADVLRLMPNPALLLDGKGRLTFANTAAEALLNARDGLQLDRADGLKLVAALPAERGVFAGAMTKSLAVASGTSMELGFPMRLTRPSAEAPLIVMSIPLPPPAFALWETLQQARVLVLIVDPATRSCAATATVQAILGLTAAEARVAVLIGSGLSGPEAAAILRVSPATVKTHLSHCFEKTGVRSQIGLARILGALPINLHDEARLSPNKPNW